MGDGVLPNITDIIFSFNTVPHLSILTLSTWYLFKHCVLSATCSETSYKISPAEFNQLFPTETQCWAKPSLLFPGCMCCATPKEPKITHDCQLQREEFRDILGEESVDCASKTSFIVIFLTLSNQH